MATETSGGRLYGIYRDRIGEPTTDDEVRGYWVFLVGLVLGTVGIALFLPSESAVGTTGITLRELSIALAGVGLAMLVAGPVVRLPLQNWANLAAYAGQVVCLAAVVWFVVVFPAGWDVQTGSQPMIVLYVLGLGIITLGGALGPLLAGVTREDLEASERRARELESELSESREEREAAESELSETREEREELEGQLQETERVAKATESKLRARLDALQESQAQFELYEDRGGKYRWRLRHRNSNIIADSAQGYTRKHNAQKGLASVRRNALGASLVHVTPEPDEDPEAALEETPLVPDVEESAAEFDLYEDEAGEYRWRLVHDNGNIIADGGEGYSSKRKARQGIESVKQNAGPAEYLQFDPASFEIYRDGAGKWRWRLVHENGNIIAASSGNYTRRRNAKRSVDSVRENVSDDRFEVYEDDAGEYRWRYRGGNRGIVATAGEGYSSRSEAESAVERVQEYAPDADALDVGSAAFEVYRDRAEEWRWRLRHRNGNIIADGGEGYASRTGAHDGIESVKKNAPTADVED